MIFFPNFSKMGKIKRERQKFHIAATGDDVEMDDGPVPMLVKAPTPAALSATDNVFAGIDIKLDKINKFAEPEAAPATEQAGTVPDGKSTKPSPYRKAKKEPTLAFKSSAPAQPERQLTKKEKQRLKHEKLLQKIDVVQQAMQKTKNKRKKQATNDNNSGNGTTVGASNNNNSVGKFVRPLPNASAELETLNREVNAAKASNVPVQKKKFSTSMKSLEEALTSLNDSLPSLDSILKMRSKDAKTGLDEDVTDGGSTSGSKGAKKGKKSQKFAKGKIKGHEKNNKPNKSKVLVSQFNHLQKLLADDTYKKNPRAVIAAHVKDKLKKRR